MSIVLRIVRQGTSCTILAMGSDKGCDLADFLQQLSETNENEFARIAALLDRTAEHGPPRNVLNL